MKCTYYTETSICQNMAVEKWIHHWPSCPYTGSFQCDDSELDTTTYYCQEHAAWYRSESKIDYDSHSSWTIEKL